MTLTAVAISGGIDSLVSAYLLQAAGHEVIGLHFLTGFEDPPVKNDATHPIHRIGEQLDIPIHILNLSAVFRQQVVAYFSSTYRAGRTPNPCLFCNPLIKFGQLWSHAARRGAEGLATGHYARVIKGPDGRYHLLQGIDRQKDQSYFLARLTPDQLARACFPLGDRLKRDVRQLAAAKDLQPLTSGESQDVCFIRNRTYGSFLAEHEGLPPRPGPIEDVEGRIIGRHQGLHLFTIGQRRGINCPAAEPYYVVRIDPVGNRLVVGSRKDLKSSVGEVVDINWINKPARFPAQARVKIRYRHRAAAARLIASETDQKVRIRFQEPQNSITPGQGAVFYDGEEVIGSGWIV
ncbi:MAG: tRNA 2-thiouridine(34) synthase MnmA [Desulfosarcina sp.]|nr:tRNA 2-thiouridine(34) synthase MnmA [Desulfobacterales bacterium]